jgi:hypothetical protein
MSRKLPIVGALLVAAVLIGGFSARNTVADFWTPAYGSATATAPDWSPMSLTHDFIVAEQAGRKSEPGIREPW